MRALDQRARTILKVATEIVRQQDAFFAHGVQHLRPLNLRTVADAISMHESTVSRVTANKYMATPRGIFELKYFFTSAIAASDGGEAHSAEAVRHRIRQLIDAENPRDVLSDDTIVEKLREAASTSPAALSQNTAKRCGFPRRSSAGARSRRNRRSRAVDVNARAGQRDRREAMPFRVSGKNIDIGEALRERVNDAHREALDKYFQRLFRPRDGRVARVSAFAPNARIHLASGITLEAEAMAADAYASADQAACASKSGCGATSAGSKTTRRRRGESAASAARPIDGAELCHRGARARERRGGRPSSIRSSSPRATTALRTLPVSEAVLELDLTGAPVMVFRHAGHGRINLVYRRADGHIGWIDPPALQSTDGH